MKEIYRVGNYRLTKEGNYFGIYYAGELLGSRYVGSRNKEKILEKSKKEVDELAKEKGAIKDKMAEVVKLAEKLKMDFIEAKFFREGAKFKKGEYGMKLEDGSYVIYYEDEARYTFKSFPEAFEVFRKITDEQNYEI